MQKPIATVICGYSWKLHRSTISAALSMLIFSGNIFSSQKLGTEHSVALLETGVTVPISDEL